MIQATAHLPFLYSRSASVGGASWAGCATELGLAGAAITVLMAVCIAVEPRCAHWFLLPVFFCGLLLAADVAGWIRGRLDPFDPKPLIGLLWFHGMCLAPLLHVAFSTHSQLFDAQMSDWPNWFGWLGLLNLIGLIAYKAAQRLSSSLTRPTQGTWVFQPGRLAAVLPCILLVSLAAASVLFFRFGGLHQDLQILAAPGGEAVHFSWLLMLGDPLPLLVTVVLVRGLASRWRTRSIVTVAVILVLLMAAQVAMLGFRGSRTAIIAAVFLGTALCHYQLRRVPILIILLGVLVIGVGGYGYAYFKRFGTVGFQAINDPHYREMLSRKAGITPMGVLLGDLSRAEIQAFLLYRLQESGSDYELRLGRTYVGAAMTFIPRALWPNKPSDAFGKVSAGTDLQYGQGRYRSDRFESSKVYGLGGEAMLNFGPAGLPAAYLLFGAGLGWYRKKISTLHPQDARIYLVPLFTMTCFIAAFGDANNTLFFLLKNGLLLILLVALSAARTRSPCTGAIPRTVIANRGNGRNPGQLTQ